MVAFFVGVGIGFALVCAFIIFHYNRLVTLNHRVDNAWSQIDVQLARRASLIPSLVKLIDAPQGDNSALVTQAEGIYREMQGGTKDIDMLDTQERLNASIKELVSLAKSGKGKGAVGNIIEEVRDTEDKISYMRQSFNDTVTRYNEALTKFPSSIIASLFHFSPRPALQIDPSLKGL